MPELPEVEYTARQLRDHIIGATISEALVFWERTIGHPDLLDFLAEIAGRQILGVRRRAKFLVLDLSGDLLLTIHRRMTGNLLLLPPGWEVDTSLQQSDPVAWNVKGPSFVEQGGNEKENGHNPSRAYNSELLYCRVCFNLMDGRKLLFTDLRKFGRIELWPRKDEREALEGLGPEPLSEEFTVERLGKALAGRKSAIKQVLLAQEVIAFHGPPQGRQVPRHEAPVGKQGGGQVEQDKGELVQEQGWQAPDGVTRCHRFRYKTGAAYHQAKGEQ